MVEMYAKNQTRFTADMHAHYIYSPRELSKWTRALYEGLKPMEGVVLEDLVRLWLHEVSACRAAAPSCLLLLQRVSCHVRVWSMRLVMMLVVWDMRLTHCVRACGRVFGCSAIVSSRRRSKSGATTPRTTSLCGTSRRWT
jgi:hypothetical protein